MSPRSETTPRDPAAVDREQLHTWLSRRLNVALEELSLWEHWALGVFPYRTLLFRLEKQGSTTRILERPEAKENPFADEPVAVLFLVAPPNAPPAPPIIGPLTRGFFEGLCTITEDKPSFVVNESLMVIGNAKAEQTLSPKVANPKMGEGAPAFMPGPAFVLPVPSEPAKPADVERLKASLLRLAWSIEPFQWRPRNDDGEPLPLDPRSAGRTTIILESAGIPVAFCDPETIDSEPPLGSAEPSAAQHPDVRPDTGRLGDYLDIPSPGPYYGLQQALSLQRFEEHPDSRFPRANLTRGGVKAFAELRPRGPEEDAFLTPEELEAIERAMWRHCEELSDSDADTLDGIMSTWLAAARSPTDRVPVCIDDLLRLRGLKAKRGGSGRRGGYGPDQRAALWRCLLHLQDIWVDVAETKPRGKQKPRKIQSKALIMTDRVGQQRIDGSMDVERILITPGAAFGAFLFGPGRQTALLSAEALRYHPKRLRIEKRLARLFAWHWRAGARSGGNHIRPYRVRTLAEEVGLETDRPKNPARVRDRLETALNRLETDRLIGGWEYRDLNEDTLPRQGWLRRWLDARVLIEAPEQIKDAYRRLDRLPASQGEGLGERFRRRRGELGLSQLRAAEQIGMSRRSVITLERGGKLNRRLQAKVSAWLDGGR